MAHPAPGRTTTRATSQDVVQQVVGYGGAALLGILALSLVGTLLHPLEVRLPGSVTCTPRTWGDEAAYALVAVAFASLVGGAVRLARHHGPNWVLGLSALGMAGLALPSGTGRTAACALPAQAAPLTEPSAMRSVVVAVVVVYGAWRLYEKALQR